MKTEFSNGDQRDPDIQIEEPISWGHNPLESEEVEQFENLLDQYGIGTDETDSLLNLWSDGKTPLMQVLGGHSLQAKIETTDLELAGNLLFDSDEHTWNTIQSWWDNLNWQKFPLYSRPTVEDILDNCLRPSGEKLGKRVSKDLPPPKRQEFLHDLSSLIGQCRTSGHIRLTVSPIELLMISESSKFRSCHSVDGEHGGGNFAYLIDPHTVMAYYWQDVKLCHLVHDNWPYKLWRQLIYVDLEHLSAAISREYPQSRQTLAKAARQLLFRKIAAWKDLPPERLIANRQPVFYNRSTAYTDNCHFKLVYLKAGGADPCISIPKEPVDVADYHCEACECSLRQSEANFSENGDPYCQDCYYERFTRCDACNQEVHNDYAYNYDSTDYCEECYNERFGLCCSCNADFPIDDLAEYAGLWYCGDCYSDNFACCDGCGVEFPFGELTELDGNWYCQDCHEEEE